MWIRTLKITNFMRFRGEHVLALEPKVYAIVAKWASNADRSNWAGKTATIEAIVFALFGDHRFSTEDEWITDEERAGSVVLELSDGTHITRSRTKGKRTEIKYSDPQGREALQEEAQVLIEQRLGLSREELSNTSYFKQKKLSQFVIERPESRMAMVSAWFDLEKLREATADTQRMLRTRRAELAQRVVERERRMEEAKAFLDTAGTVEELAKKRAWLDGAHERLKGYQERAERSKTSLRDQRIVSEYDSLVTAGKALKLRIEQYEQRVDFAQVEKLRTEWNEILGELSVDNSQLKSIQACAVRDWDRKCPLVGFECPVANSVIAADNTALVSTLRTKIDTRNREREVLARQISTFEREQAEQATNVRSIENMRENVAALFPEYQEAKQRLSDAPKEENDGEEHRNLVQQICELHETIVRCEEARKNHDRIMASLGEEPSDPSIQLYAAACSVLIAAERRVAEGNLAKIEVDANRMLEDCGIDLTVSMQWAREGKDLAKICPQCGASFPASAKVKYCKCGATRERNIIRRLDVALSDDSGAAEDLAGAAIQLSASHWLRSKRASAFGVALIDEPFGACDKANRRGFAVNLTKILSNTFEQAFVISHSPDTVEMFPGKILIKAGPNASIPEVV